MLNKPLCRSGLLVLLLQTNIVDDKGFTSAVIGLELILVAASVQDNPFTRLL